MYGYTDEFLEKFNKIKRLNEEIERLNNIVNKVLFILEHIEDDRVGYETCIDLLKGVDKE